MEDSCFQRTEAEQTFRVAAFLFWFASNYVPFCPPVFPTTNVFWPSLLVRVFYCWRNSNISMFSSAINSTNNNHSNNNKTGSMWRALAVTTIKRTSFQDLFRVLPPSLLFYSLPWRNRLIDDGFYAPRPAVTCVHPTSCITVPFYIK